MSAPKIADRLINGIGIAPGIALAELAEPLDVHPNQIDYRGFLPPHPNAEQADDS